MSTPRSRTDNVSCINSLYGASLAYGLSQTSRVDGVAHHAIAAARVTRVPLQDATAIAVSDIRDNNETDFHM